MSTPLLHSPIENMAQPRKQMIPSLEGKRGCVFGFLHPGSGVGNQLHRYVATRVLALDKGCDYAMIGKEFCKVKDFMNLSLGDHDVTFHVERPAGKIVVDSPHALWEEKTNYFNPEFFFCPDGTVIDGEFQSPQYFIHRMKDIEGWLNVEYMEVPDDVCMIGFRGGEFYVFAELGLPKEYYDEGIKMMKKINPKMKFEVHTDDPDLAKWFFPEFKIIHNVGINWRSIRWAKYAIIANSSFYILPRLLAHRTGAMTVAPRFWARYNTKEWSRPDNFYREFTYI